LETLEFGLSYNLGDEKELKELIQGVLENPTNPTKEMFKVVEMIIKNDIYVNRIKNAVIKANKTLSHVENVRKIYILNRDFTQENDELTPTLKTKRNMIEKNFKDIFDKLYDDEGFGYSIPSDLISKL
jgi:long-chain acyl-CoA synthetase